jgi:hypothetical protein
MQQDATLKGKKQMYISQNLDLCCTVHQIWILSVVYWIWIFSRFYYFQAYFASI